MLCTFYNLRSSAAEVSQVHNGHDVRAQRMVLSACQAIKACRETVSLNVQCAII